MALSRDLIISVALSVWCLSFQFGYNIAACDSAKPGFSADYGIEISGYDADGSPIETTWWGTNVVAIFGLGAMFGSMFVSTIVNKLGPKQAMYIVNLFSILSAAVMFKAGQVPTWE